VTIRPAFAGTRDGADTFLGKGAASSDPPCMASPRSLRANFDSPKTYVFSQFQAWMTRQFQYLYFYEPWGYWLSFVMLCTTLLSFVLLPLQLTTGIFASSMSATAICVVSISCLGGTIAALAKGMRLSKKLLCTLAIPLVIGSTVAGLINCMFTDMIKWKHKAYRIASDGSIAEVIDLVPNLTPKTEAIEESSSIQEIG